MPRVVESERKAVDGAAEVMQLRQHLAPGRHADFGRGRSGGLIGGGRDRLQAQRRPPGVGRRRDPDDGLDRQPCGAVAAVELERLPQPLRRHAAGLNQPDQQQKNQRGAQRPRIAPRQIGARRADLQAPHRLAQPFQMAPPQQPGGTVLTAAREPIAERAQRLVWQPVDLLQAA